MNVMRLGEYLRYRRVANFAEKQKNNMGEMAAILMRSKGAEALVWPQYYLNPETGEEVEKATKYYPVAIWDAAFETIQKVAAL